tara:strand:- start:489 stop:737 length:249 start_codon:yes stop_codon:yes gene_type:complete
MIGKEQLIDGVAFTAKSSSAAIKVFKIDNTGQWILISLDGKYLANIEEINDSSIVWYTTIMGEMIERTTQYSDLHLIEDDAQ